MTRITSRVDGKRALTEGIGFGVIAGVVFLAAEMVAFGAADPLRMAASLVLGFHALDSTLGTTYLAGLVVHLVLSGAFGLIYGELEARLPEEPRRHYGIQIGIAAAFAVLLWLVNVEIVGEAVLPWFVAGAPMAHVVVIALFYGVPLGWMFAAAERRLPQVIHPSVG